jgi:hypothetical protein
MTEDLKWRECMFFSAYAGRRDGKGKSKRAMEEKEVM